MSDPSTTIVSAVMVTGIAPKSRTPKVFATVTESWPPRASMSRETEGRSKSTVSNVAPEKVNQPSWVAWAVKVATSSPAVPFTVRLVGAAIEMGSRPA